MAIGIVAYGSLLPHPGAEIDGVTELVVSGLMTRFPVEFARSSKGRDGAPTLVPSPLGAPVSCGLILLREEVSVEAARDLLFRRETDRVGSGELYGSQPRGWIRELTEFGPADVALYTALGANITPLSAERLADLAIASARAPAGARRRDGISYLMSVLDYEIETPLSTAYETELLDRLSARNLDEAWQAARSLA